MRTPGPAAPGSPAGVTRTRDPVYGERLVFRYAPAVGASRTWTEAHQERYRSTGAVAVKMAVPEDLAFVRALPGLQSFFTQDRVRDDTPVFDVPTLEELVLYDRCRKPLQGDRLPALRHLVIDHRPGLETLQDHPQLLRLQVHGVRETSLSWLGAPPVLEELHLHGRWQQLDPGAASGAARLRVLNLTEVVLDDVTPLTALTSLEHLQLDVRSSDARPLDLRPLLQLPRLRVLQLERTAVASLDPLRDHPALLVVGQHERAPSAPGREALAQEVQQRRAAVQE